MGYSDYFNFEREPFSNAPNEKFYFNSEQHRRALQRLKYSVDTDKGLAVLVGGIGTGKTTLARRMLDNLPVERYESSLLVIIHSDITPEWLLSRICLQLGVENPDPTPLKMLKQLFERLIEIEEEGRKAVVLIDEAQMLQTRELMEEFRGLLNLEIPGKKLLNIIFFGLPALDEVMMLDEPLAQRVAFKYTLTSFEPRETAAYIAFRLKVSGCDQSPFLPETLPLIQSYSGGVPRLINTICDNALFETYLRHGREVTEGIITSVVEDLGLKMLAPVAADLFFDQAADDDDLELVFDELEQK
ncbi:ExeA family protein [Pelovirga terrestris]|uniref:AAA family ATPase n=1 Tax=Pelovirga terrestris TaxID=2771352 RepID=A0A8J6QJJ0_9BACT|nr:AAA family ATPase [Pelovirga terrestris]MBD1399184.1 AAA family ATPase [Pelovirga terrestris]